MRTTTTSKTTPAERALAVRQVRDTSRYERRSIMAAARIGFNAQRTVLAAYRRGERKSILPLSTAELLKGKDELRDAMVFGHLAGLLRVRKRVASLSSTVLSLSAVSRAIDILLYQLELSEIEADELSEQYDAHAFRIMSDASESVEQRLQTAMIEATRKGAHVREGVKLLGKAFEDSGLTPSSSYQLEAIFRTQTQMAYSAAKWQANQRPEIQEILWGYKYVTVGDDRVRPSHELLDGVTLPKDHPFWLTNWTPNGWGCRCQILEIFEEREMVLPPEGPVEVDGLLVTAGPDEGFAFNPGEALALSFETGSLRLGGEGSGHWGHAGRPGEVGGSLPGVGGIGRGKDSVVKKADEAQAKVDAWAAREKEINTFRIGKARGTAGTFYGLGVGEVEEEGLKGVITQTLPLTGENIVVLPDYDIEFDVSSAPLANAVDRGTIKVPREVMDLVEGRGSEDETWGTDLVGALSLKMQGVEIIHFRHPETGATTSVDFRDHTVEELKGALENFLLPADEGEEFSSEGWRTQSLSLGGEGSGHWGHAGRPGEVGGSLPGAGGVRGKRRSKKEAKRILRESGWEPHSRRETQLAVRIIQQHPNIEPKRAADIAEHVADYSTTEYTYVNRKLRKGKTSNRIKQLTTGFAACDPVRKGTTVYRGVSLEGRSRVLIPQLHPGRVIAGKAFLSATRKQSVAERFTSELGGGALFKLRDRRGLGRDISSFCVEGQEEEIIYPPNTRIKIRKVQRQEDFITVLGDIL